MILPDLAIVFVPVVSLKLTLNEMEPVIVTRLNMQSLKVMVPLALVAFSVALTVMFPESHGISIISPMGILS